MNQILSLIRDYGHACSIRQAWATAGVSHQRQFDAGQSPEEIFAKIEAKLKEQGQ